MHTTKFRGKILNGPRKGEWVYGYYANILGDHLIIDNSGIQYIVDPKTVGQYTGLVDWNGKEIYIDDMLLKKDWGQKERWMGPVVFQVTEFVVKYKNYRNTKWVQLTELAEPENLDWEVVGYAHDLLNNLLQ